MLKTIWKEINTYFQTNESATLREVSESTGAPISTVAYHKARKTDRISASGTDQWETAWGQNFLKRMIISVIYTFGIVAAVSESSIYRLTNEIISNILWYKELQDAGLVEQAQCTLEELEVVLGLDVKI